MQSNASFIEAAGVALSSLRGSKLRSFLTLLGIILSTTTLIAVMSLINGMDVYIATSASSMGTEGFRVLRMAFVGQFNPRRFLEMQRRNPLLQQEEFEFVRSHATLVREAGLSVGRGGKVTYEGDTVDATGINGVSSAVAIMSNAQVETGRFFTDTDDQRRLMVTVLGADIKQRYFPNSDPWARS